MRIPFNDVFEINLDGSVSPKVEVHFEGHVLGTGIPIQPGQWIGELNISAHLGKDVEVEEQGHALLLMGFFP
jgi:hypothetical protein